MRYELCIISRLYIVELESGVTMLNNIDNIDKCGQQKIVFIKITTSCSVFVIDGLIFI